MCLFGGDQIRLDIDRSVRENFLSTIECLSGLHGNVPSILVDRAFYVRKPRHPLPTASTPHEGVAGPRVVAPDFMPLPVTPAFRGMV